MQKFPYKTIRTHYNQIISDIRKKENLLYSSLKEAISMLDRTEKDPHETLSIDQIINPLDLLVKQKVVKSYSPLLSIFQTLAASGYLVFTQKLLFLDIATKLLDSNDDMMPIRVLQILLIVITRDDVGRSPMANKILSLCLKTFASKNPSVKNNVFAVLRQMHSLLFGECAKTTDVELQKVCYEQLDQLIIVAGDKYKQMRFKCLAMDIITVILIEGRETLSNHTQLTELLQNAYTPWLKNYLVHNAESYPIISRVIKSATQLILTLRNSYFLLQPMLVMTSSVYSWHRYLVLESFCTLFGEYKQIQLMHNLLIDIIKTFVNIIPKHSEKQLDESFTPLNLIRGNKVHEMSEAVPCDPPIPMPFQYMTLLDETLTKYVVNLEEAFRAEEIKLGSIENEPFTQRQMQQAINILESTWKPIYDMLESMLKESDSEIQVQQILHDMQSMINMAGSVKLTSDLAKLVERLCSWELPIDLEERTWDTGYKHIYVSNAIFNITQCLNKILNKESWVHIFAFLQKVNARVNKAEGSISELELIRSNALSKKIAEDFARYLPKDAQPEMPKIIQRTSEPLEAESHANNPDPFIVNEEDKNHNYVKENTSPVSQGDLKRLNTQPVHKSEDRKITPEEIPSRQLTSNAGMNFYKLNSMLSKIEESIAKSDQDINTDTKGRKVSKGSLHSEIESMRGSLDYLFVYTSLFDQSTLVEFVGGLAELTMQSIDLGLKGPDAKDIKSSHMFSFVKLIETAIANISRIHYIWDYLDAHLEFLASLKIPLLRSLSISSMACLITNVFDYHKGKIWKEINNPKWVKDKWQIIILSPLMNSLFIGDPECAYEVILNLRCIMENCGPYIVHEGWEVVLCIIEKAITIIPSNTTSSPYSTERIEQTFKCLEHICHNSLHKIHVLSIEKLIAIIYYFTTLRDSLNTSLLAVAFIHDVADYISQQQLSNKWQDLPKEKIDEIWIKLLDKLKDIGMDERGELRSAAYRTLEQIMVEHGKNLPIKIWSYSLIDLSITLLQFVKVSYQEFIKLKVVNSPKMNEDEKGIDEQKSKEKALEESVTVLYSSFVRAIKILYSLNDSISSEERLQIVIKAWSCLLENWESLSKNSSHSILSTIYKSIQQITLKCPICINQQLDKTWTIFTESITWAISQAPTHTRSTSLISKLVSSIMSTLHAIFSQQTAKELIFPMSYQIALYGLLKEITTSISIFEGTRCDPTKIFAEEKIVFDFIEFLPKTFEDIEMYKQYISFLLEFLKFRIEVPQSDGIIRRILSIIRDSVIVHELNEGLLKILIPELYMRLEDIMTLRFDSELCKVLLANSRTCQSLWHIVVKQFIAITTYLINPNLYENDANKIEPKSETKEKYMKEICSDKELQSLVWKSSLQFIDKAIKYSEASLALLSKPLMDSISKLNQELDVTLITFIETILLPSSIEISKESQESLINLLGSGCNSSGSFISKLCTDALLDLCNKNKECSKEFLVIKQKMAGLAAITLINNCKEMLHKYIEDEDNSVETPLSIKRKQILMELLVKLKETSFFPNILPKEDERIADLLTEKNAHLIYLMPEIVNCISTKEADLRDILKQVLQEVNKMLLGKMANITKLTTK